MLSYARRPLRFTVRVSVPRKNDKDSCLHDRTQEIIPLNARANLDLGDLLKELSLESILPDGLGDVKS